MSQELIREGPGWIEYEPQRPVDDDWEELVSNAEDAMTHACFILVHVGVQDVARVAEMINQTVVTIKSFGAFNRYATVEWLKGSRSFMQANAGHLTRMSELFLSATAMGLASENPEVARRARIIYGHMGYIRELESKLGCMFRTLRSRRLV